MRSLFGTKKKLARERSANQQLQNQLVEAQRQRAFQEDQLKQERQRQQDEIDERTRAARALEAQLAEERESNQRRESIARLEEAKRRQEQQNKEQLEREQVEQGRRREQESQKKLREASAETLRDLRELIRSRYEMDVTIWSLRNARRPDKPIVHGHMDKADAIMDEILLMIEAWGDNSDGRWNEEEWAKVEIIRKKVRTGGYRTWTDNPPWN